MSIAIKTIMIIIVKRTSLIPNTAKITILSILKSTGQVPKKMALQQILIPIKPQQASIVKTQKFWAAQTDTKTI